MDWIESIKTIKKAQENNQLIVFEGAGVSKNSNVPTWWELIKIIADKIGYDRCDFCKKRKEICPETDCEERYAFTQDEFLRIPEYYYQKDTSDNNTEYYNLIQNTLSSGKMSNSIDDEIFNLLPHHIITTNYDSLLEDSANLNAQLYTVVSQDSDLLSKSNERYIIKMHGDLKVPNSIVLKESDYLDYEQKHTLISTFIRSLLVNHTFVFLGYSLNDYNLNLIIGWINYFRKFYGVAERPSNFLVSSEAPSEYERVRLEDKSIFVVDLSSLPDNLMEKVSIPVSLTNPTGQKLFSFLRCITDSKIFQQYIPLSEILIEKYHVLESYRKVSFEDLIQVQPLGHTTFMSTELVFYDKEWYEQIAALIVNNVQGIIDTFQRAGLTAIHLFEDDLSQSIPLITEENTSFQLYLNNDYVELLKQVQACSDTDEKIYYYHLVGNCDAELEKIIEMEASTIASDDYIAILLHKMRVRVATITLFNRQDSKTKELEQLFNTVPIKYHSAINYLKKLFESSAKNMLKTYSEKIGTRSGVYVITDISYDFDRRSKDVTLCCTECGNVIHRYMTNGKNKWSELIKTCACQKKRKEENKESVLKNSEKIKKGIIVSRVGEIFGDFEIISVDDLEENPKYTIRCVECGYEKVVSAKSGNFERRKNFDCTKHYIQKIKFDESYVGKKNNRLTVLKISRINNKKVFECMCDCGNVKYVEPNFWEDGSVKSCGCLKKDLTIPHSKELDRLRRIHGGMKQRCYNH